MTMNSEEQGFTIIDQSLVIFSVLEILEKVIALFSIGGDFVLFVFFRF